MTPDLTFSRHNPAEAEDLLDDVIVPLYEASHADVIDNPFYSGERFAERVRESFKAPGFEIVIARAGHTPVGQAFGYALPERARWWDGLTTPVPDGFTDETGSRTFALNELMVVPDRQGQGVAHALHDELLGKRAEQRATLLVREDNTGTKRLRTLGLEEDREAAPLPRQSTFRRDDPAAPTGRLSCRRRCHPPGACVSSSIHSRYDASPPLSGNEMISATP